MYANILKNAFDPVFEAPLQAWQEYVDHCEVVHFQKDEVIKKQGASERYFYFIVEGSAGLFLWKEVNFVCLDFAFDHSFCADIMSIYTRKPTPLQVTALEKSVMLRMPVQTYHQLTRLQTGAVIHIAAAESSFVEKQQQQIELLTCTAEERYQILLHRFPGIMNRIAQKHIASYLGITPQSLSRIRAGFR